MQQMSARRTDLIASRPLSTGRSSSARQHGPTRHLGFGCVALAALALLAAPPAEAQVGIGVKGGTQGLGAELTVGILPQLEGRLGINGYSYSDRRDAGGIEYDAEANLRTGSALLDWHPGGRGFRLTGGLVYNATEIEGLSITPASGTYPIGNLEVPAALLGNLRGEIDFDPVVPYAGLGWGAPLAAGGRVGASLDLGVFFQGDGDVTLTPIFAPGSPIPDIPGAEALLRSQLDLEEREIEEDIADYELYPVLSFGITFRL
jgi:hypothetical protein